MQILIIQIFLTIDHMLGNNFLSVIVIHKIVRTDFELGLGQDNICVLARHLWIDELHFFHFGSLMEILRIAHFRV